ncbi:MAG: type II secretion system protein [bacterium]|nr:type II secretion system protein [bacterium]
MKKGFTLIELLVVIAILAILAVAVILVINPVQILMESRDATRISDLNTLNNAIALYLADVSTTSTAPTWTATTTCTYGAVAPSSSLSGTCQTYNTIYTTTGTGWVYGVNFTAVRSGSPIGHLPVDPNNGSSNCGGTPAVCFYAFKTDGTFGKYKLMANMESLKYANGGGSTDMESNNRDGGNIDTWFETGTDLTF